jgi:uracil-DNA glycosylase
VTQEGDAVEEPEYDDEMLAIHRRAMPWGQRLPSIHALLADLDGRRDAGEVMFPARGLETTALQATPFAEVRVVLLGIDPYPSEDDATGLAFSVPPGRRLRPGVRNMKKAVRHDYPIDGRPAPLTGDLTPWARQGVLLLNRALTFPKGGQAGDHLPLWTGYTDEVLRSLRGRGVVFVLLGREAQRVRPLLDGEAVIVGDHPSAPGRQTRFERSGLFRRINDALAPADRSDWGPC